MAFACTESVLKYIRVISEVFMCKQCFSVAMSVYKKDNPSHFDISLNSITDNQTVIPNEVVLVVDGEVTDELNLVINRHCAMHPELFHVIRLPENKGLGNALKVALEHCSNELVARMDSDDIAVSDRFKTQLEYFATNPQIDILGGDISEFIGSEDNIVAFRRVPKIDIEIREYLKKRCPFNHMTVMYKKQAVLDAGGYLDLFWNEDYYLWIRMAQKGAIMANTGSVLVNVRTGEDMYKRRGGKKYFKTEKFLQKYMLDIKMIHRRTYITNIVKRWMLQCAMPNGLRGIIFRKFARNKN